MPCENKDCPVSDLCHPELHTVPVLCTNPEYTTIATQILQENGAYVGTGDPTVVSRDYSLSPQAGMGVIDQRRRVNNYHRRGRIRRRR